MDMRRYRVMIGSGSRPRANSLFKNLENQRAAPGGQNARTAWEWTKGLDFEVPVFDGNSRPTPVPVLGRLRRRVRRRRRRPSGHHARAAAPLGHEVRGARPEETTAGDPARRSGNEFVFDAGPAERSGCSTRSSPGAGGTTKIVTTCPHCLNTLGREYPQLDGHYEVVHHTQLLGWPGAGQAGAGLGPGGRTRAGHLPRPLLPRAAEVYEEPRALVRGLRRDAVSTPTSPCAAAPVADVDGADRRRIEASPPGAAETLTQAGRSGEPSGTLAVGCPFCRTLTGSARAIGEAVKVQDVSQIAARRRPPRRRPEPEERRGHHPGGRPTTDTPAVATPGARSPRRNRERGPVSTPAGVRRRSRTGTATSSGNGSSNGSTRNRCRRRDPARTNPSSHSWALVPCHGTNSINPGGEPADLVRRCGGVGAGQHDRPSSRPAAAPQAEPQPSTVRVPPGRTSSSDSVGRVISARGGTRECRTATASSQIAAPVAARSWSFPPGLGPADPGEFPPATPVSSATSAGYGRSTRARPHLGASLGVDRADSSASSTERKV
ncbi:hypothetical protein HBB16_05750 [Pseudonocardia sp. MCCB 268]|nr:hypothetical protein [Pseudonocardia cytotoxica]